MKTVDAPARTVASHRWLLGLLGAAATLAAGCREPAPCGADRCGSDGSVEPMPDAAVPEPDGSTPMCDDSTCPPATCAELDCGAHRLCEETSLGPMCADACEDGYELDPVSEACEPCEGLGCDDPTPTCEDDVPGSIADSCELEHRKCVEDASGATCGACADGFRNEDDECVVDGECGTGDCEPGARCQPGYALASDGLCRACVDLVCGADGETTLHDQRDATNQCICNTDPGYYWHPTQRKALPCDEDGDGWISSSAWTMAQRGATDPAVANVAKACTIRTVDRVVLENEYGQELTVLLCDEGFLLEDGVEPGECTPEPLPLVEDDRNDSDVKLAAPQNASEVPLYGGRRLLARELNALTKACVSIAADFDASDAPDIAQAQPASLPFSLLARWSAFAYFMELHTSRYVGDDEDDEAPGTLVIAERSRCVPGGGSAELPVGYATGASEYFRECARRRDRRYDASSNAPGFDFAQWSCDATTGTCPVPSPLLDLGTDVAQADIPPHGLCNSELDWDAAGAFRGMHHHSQFKCVLVSGAVEPSPYEMPLAAFHYVAPPETNGYLDFQICAAAPATADANPGFECDVIDDVAPTYGMVGWAAVRYSATTSYSGADALTPFGGTAPTLREVAGCIDEYAWEGLCSTEAFESRANRSPLHGDWTSFGQLLHCGPVRYVWTVDSPPEPVWPEPERTLTWADDDGVGGLWESD